MSQHVTVLIPCKNERDNILECIDSARMIGDEILIADSGSTDGTVQIVRQESGCRLIQREWNGYAAFKNWAIPQSTYPWVLILDADERVTEDLASEIRQQLASCTKDVDAWRVRFTTYFMGHELRHSNWNNGAVRLIRRDVCRYDDQLVHEDFKVEPGRLRHLRNRLTHYSIQNYDQYFQKYLRYTELGAVRCGMQVTAQRYRVCSSARSCGSFTSTFCAAGFWTAGWGSKFASSATSSTHSLSRPVFGRKSNWRIAPKGLRWTEQSVRYQTPWN